jgi:uncharacterized Zn-binding protein involved in type VI secretion
MPFAARIGDMTAHPGVIAGPGMPNVLIGGMPVAVAMDQHICAFPPPAGPHPPSPFPKGSLTVLVGGRGVLRVGDVSGCGAPIISGMSTVIVGG